MVRLGEQVVSIRKQLGEESPVYKQSVDMLDKFKRERFEFKNAAGRIGRLWRGLKKKGKQGKDGPKDGDSDLDDKASASGDDGGEKTPGVSRAPTPGVPGGPPPTLSAAASQQQMQQQQMQQPQMQQQPPVQYMQSPMQMQMPPQM